MPTDELDPELASLPEIQAHMANVQPNGVAQEQKAASGRRRPPPRRGARAFASPPPPPAPQFVDPPTEAPAPAAAPPRPGIDETKSATVVWPRILQEQIAQGYTPEHIGIRVMRIPTGPQKSPPTELASIDGSLVSGSENISPGEALYEYVVGFYHSGFTGPATYKFSFFYRFGATGGGAKVNIPGSAELALDHPKVIERQMESAARAKDAQRHGAQAQPGAPLGTFGGFGHMQRGTYGYPQQPTQGPQPTQREADLMRELARENGKWEGIFQQMQNTPPAATPAATAATAYDPRLPPPGVRADEWEMIQENRNARGVAKAVVQALTAMGITPGAMQPAAPVAVVPAVAQTPVSLLGALNDAVTMLKELGTFQKKVAEVLPGAAGGAAEPAEKEEDPALMKPLGGGLVRYPGSESPMVGREKLEDESWFEYLFQMAVNNPAAAQDIMGKAMGVLDPAALKELTMAVASRIKAPAAPGATPAPTAPTVEAPKMGWQP